MARDTQYTLYKTARTDPTFKNIWAFESEAQREAWLNTCSPEPFLNNKYWRVGSTIKCPIRYEESFNYDYVRIVNRDTDSNQRKTWFCFITGRAYISNNCTMFTLAVDYVQTFYFSRSEDGRTYPFWQISGFIVKSTNSILPPRGTASEYPVPESTCINFEWGNSGYSVLIYSTINLEDLEHLSYRSAVIDGQYIACPPYLMAVSTSGELTTLSKLISDVNSKGYTDAISGIYLVPNDYLNIESIPSTPTAITDASLSSLFSTIDVNIDRPTNCDGYVPVNKELLGYDYSYFTINNGQGEITTWHFEDFNGTPNFKARLSVSSGSPVLILWPNNYINVDQNCSRQMAIKVTQAPACSYLNDSYKIWLAQTQNSRAAAINGAQLAVDQAKFARENSLKYQVAQSVNPILDFMTNNDRETLQASYKNATTLLNTGTFNGKNAITNIVETIMPSAPANLKNAFPSNKSFGGGSSTGGGGGRSWGSGSSAGDIIESLVNMGELYVKNQLGIENWYVYDQNVASAQANLNSLLASYADKSRVPATAVGSNAYGDMCVLQQYGFMIAVYTPTFYYAKWIDNQLSAGGHTVNRYLPVAKSHEVFDYFAVNSARILGERNGRPQYARNMLISLLSQGVYLWYVYNGDISEFIGIPYGLDNPDVSNG